MAINITYSAQTFTPAYNPVEFYFSGSNANKLSYRYIVEVYDANNNRISKQKVVPQINGQGKIDISRILSNLVTVSFNPLVNQINNASNSYLNYRISIGEEYVPDAWVYTGITSFNYSGKLAAQLNGITAHSFVTNDQIFVTNSQSLSVQGFKTVLTGSTPNVIVLNWTFNNPLNATSSNGTSNMQMVRNLLH
jgi:hypothetical protein